MRPPLRQLKGCTPTAGCSVEFRLVKLATMSIEHSENPYAAPNVAVPAIQSMAFGWKHLALWSALAGLLAFSRGTFLKIFTDLGLEIPTLTTLVVSPIFPFAILGVGLFAAFTSQSTITRRQRRTSAAVSIFAAFLLTVFVIGALMFPLTSLIVSLSG